MTQTATPDTDNPFSSRGVYSPTSVQLMRAMSEFRKDNGVQVSTPSQVLSVVKSIGYSLEGSPMSEEDQARLFALAMERYKAQEGIAHPSCEDVLNVVCRLGFVQAEGKSVTRLDGLPIDRRRREADGRSRKSERRSSLEPSAQELLDLSEEENEFLDRLKALRQETGRQFASSEELLSIVWGLGYRPVGEEGGTKEWLDEDERCGLQAAFTNAVEARLADPDDETFLTCRGIFQIIDEIGLRRI